ncbi:hypothetical protein HMPREF0063_12516 [Aeromicrobium marinum DSM 15272]|uniref:Uncharacterized protein n=1 Tax=Aeromicrobium marinum DSM 15272 TaxID=585531 RepID=E2SEQ7_9ACTN|nr:hypothetical protein HMPREF0063_12516 [Aeromicrobium marinum DSM 15272]
MDLNRRDPDEEFDTWLRASCESQGVPVAVTDPEALKRLAVLLKRAG